MFFLDAKRAAFSDFARLFDMTQIGKLACQHFMLNKTMHVR
jgi:hypothetical protein